MTIGELGKDVRGSRRWMVTGVAGFIGSHLAEFLLKNGQQVVGVDDFSTGKAKNLELVRDIVGAESWRNFRFQRCDIRDLATLEPLLKNVEIVLHQAALGSVPRSLKDPLTSSAVNIGGFLNVLEASRQAGVRRFVYAASGSTYGDHVELPKVEERIGRPLSPYAVTKYVNELFAEVFTSAYGISTVGLRYFNVFGPRQDPDGPYAAVIPKWIAAAWSGNPPTIYGDGETSRDFTYVENVVQANMLAALAESIPKSIAVYNVAFGERTSLNNLFEQIVAAVEKTKGAPVHLKPIYAEFRSGDIRHSLASIEKARQQLGYVPRVGLKEGLILTAEWYKTFGVS